MSEIVINLLESKNIVSTYKDYSISNNEEAYHIIAGEQNATKFLINYPSSYDDNGYRFFVEMVNARGYGISKTEIIDKSFVLPNGMAVAGYGYASITAEKENEIIKWLPIKLKVWNTIPTWEKDVTEGVKLHISPEGNLIYISETGAEINLGNIIGPEGPRGPKGDPGNTTVFVDGVEQKELFLTSTQLIGGGITVVNELPTATKDEYDKHLLYLNGIELKYIAEYLESGQVSNIASLPTSRYSCSSVAYNGKVYIIGGRQQSGDVTNEIIELDPETNIAKKVAELPIATSSTSAVLFGDIAYIFGGEDNNGETDTIYKYDITNNVCTLVGTLPKKQFGTSAVAYNGMAYIIGGEADARLNTILQFNPADNSVITLPTTLPQSVRETSAVVIDNNAYIFSGLSTLAINSIFKFDLNTKTITTLSATLSEYLRGTSAVAINGKAYIIGGVNKSDTKQKSIIKFDPIINACSIISTSLPSVRYATCATNIDNIAYVSGGYGTSAINEILKIEFTKFYKYRKITSTEL